MAPPDLTPLAGTVSYALIFLALGFGFGAVLEASGFGDSRRLAAQFYLHDMTVLKVMFTAIITAAVLIHLSSALGLLDLERIWINPTFLIPGIVGGLIMGVGFIIGGFCPGTSLVAAATLKLDGIFFVLGVFGGVALFGETVGRFDAFWHSTSMGRFTLADWMGVPEGVAVVLLVLMAVGMFVAAEASERYFGAKRRGVAGGSEPGGAPASSSRGRRVPVRLAGAGALVLLALATALIGQPDAAARWESIAAREGAKLRNREIFVDPAEVVEIRRNLTLSTQIYEVRPERDYNLFHLEGSKRIDPADAGRRSFARTLAALPDNAVIFLIGNGEPAAVEAWKALRAQGVPNLYVVEGGINRWLEIYPLPASVAERRTAPDDRLAWRFAAAVGGRGFAAHPDLARDDLALAGGRHEAGSSAPSAREPDVDLVDGSPDAARASGGRHHVQRGELHGGSAGSSRDSAHGASPHVASMQDSREFTRKVKIQRKVAAKGGCG